MMRESAKVVSSVVGGRRIARDKWVKDGEEKRRGFDLGRWKKNQEERVGRDFEFYGWPKTWGRE
jgi:hypothetical protein